MVWSPVRGAIRLTLAVEQDEAACDADAGAETVVVQEPVDDAPAFVVFDGGLASARSVGAREGDVREVVLLGRPS